MLSDEVFNEIQHVIQSEFDYDIDTEQLLNHLRETEYGYRIFVYGVCFDFNKEGDRIWIY